MKMIKEFDNRKQWRSWLEKYHDVENEVWLVLYKKKYGKTTFCLG